MTTPAKRQETAVEQVPATSEVVALMGVIERAARDPNVDIDKMERLLAMQERVVERQAKMAFDAAMTMAQESMEAVRKDAKNPSTKSRYASYAVLDRAIRPIYTGHGFSVTFDTGDGAPADHVRVLGYVSHSGGYSRTYKLDMPADGKGAKGGDVMTKTHATGSAITYGKRYLLQMIFNIAVGDTDDDGRAAGAAERVSQEQLNELLALADEVGADKTKFCQYMRAENFADISAANFDRAKSALERKRQKA